MMSYRHAVYAVVLLIAMPLALVGQDRQGPEPGSAEQVVRDIYSLVSFSAGTLPDWGKVEEHFHPDANVFLRVTRDSSRLFTVQGFIDDFVHFIETTPAKDKGFTERVLQVEATEFGNIAHVFVLYDAQIVGSKREPQKGVDSWHLVRSDGVWKILSIVNEVPSPARPLPEMFSRDE